MSDNCLFCKILKGEIHAIKVYEDDFVLGMKDIYPQAKSHFLFVHKNHTNNVNEMSEDPSSIGQIYSAIKKFSETNDLAKNGFRVVTNLGSDAGQTVFHTHFHVLGGEKLRGFGSR